MRLSEIHSIRKENFHETYIDLIDQYLNGNLRPLKTKESRKIPLCSELYKLLKDRMGSNYDFEDVAETMASDTLREVLLKNMPDRKKERGYCFRCYRL